MAQALATLPDTQPPSVSFASPATGDILKGTVQVQVTATDNRAVASVSITVDGLTAATLTTAPYVLTWDTTKASNAAHTLAATATDTSGNSAIVHLTVTVSNAPPDGIPPTVNLIAPTNDSNVNSMVWVAARASDNVGITQVELYMNRNLIGTSTLAAATYWVSSQSWPRGACVLEAKAYDVAGNSTWSAPITVYTANNPAPDSTPPSVTIIAPTAGTTVNSMLWAVARATDNIGISEVDLYLDGTLIGTSTAAAASYWVSTQTWSNGPHALTAKAYDIQRNSSWSPPVTVYK